MGGGEEKRFENRRRTEGPVKDEKCIICYTAFQPNIKLKCWNNTLAPRDGRDGDSLNEDGAKINKRKGERERGEEEEEWRQ